MSKAPSYDMRECSIGEVQALCAQYHAYAGAGSAATYAFGVYEDGRLVAAYSWQPPPPGAAKAVCPEAPQGVLALSRMVAVPREERLLRHVSTPLRRQMRQEIDRGRWPVLLTYSDEGAGHTGHVYKCAGWQKGPRTRRPVFEDAAGVRRSTYRAGRHSRDGLCRAGYTYIQRWEHWACAVGEADVWMTNHGWARVPTGKTWRSGRPAYTYLQVLA